MAGIAIIERAAWGRVSNGHWRRSRSDCLIAFIYSLVFVQFLQKLIEKIMEIAEKIFKTTDYDICRFVKNDYSI